MKASSLKASRPFYPPLTWSPCRAAINLTAHLLEMYGQGKGKAGQLSKHSQTSFQGTKHNIGSCTEIIFG